MVYGTPPPDHDVVCRLPLTVPFKEAPPPKNIERDIYEYVDRKNKDTFFTTNLL